jgi:bifunctional DNA-binding transcriptional regulator/antitoxin component of YhaV-PrlF toxin-antitoxin module
MTSVIRDSNLLPIPEEIVKELDLQSGTSVDVTRTPDGFEVKRTRTEVRRGASGAWLTQAERMAIAVGVLNS